MDFDHLFSTFRISASGLEAERARIRVIANNLANANVTRTADGEPFRKDLVVFREVLDREAARRDPGCVMAGVSVEKTIKSTEPFRTEYQPGHPDADPATGMLRLPNVDPVSEMVDLITASRAYQANLSVITTFKEMMLQTLRISR